MKAVRINETGGPDVLGVEEVDTPAPGDGELLVRVKAASVNPVDWKYRRGDAPSELPITPGRDVAGTVEISRADAFAEGDAVLANVPGGGYAEFAAATAHSAARKPDALTWEQAAALPVAGMTAWQALFDRGGLEAGQTALIAGAAGGVGHLAVQFAETRAPASSGRAPRATATSCSASARTSTSITRSRTCPRRRVAWTWPSTRSEARPPRRSFPRFARAARW